jgi:calcineurin-like phosphoesterase family protein
MNIFITSDHHFGHKNILQYCHRSFDNIEQHDAALIRAWNNIVKPEDLVQHLGDFTLLNAVNALKYFNLLNGKIRILCNEWHHDGRWLRDWDEVYPKVYFDEALIVWEKPQPIILCHYPFEIWDRKHYGALHFHGHSHGELHKIINRLDVGVDNAYRLLGEYRPFKLDEAIYFATLEMNEKA